MALLGAPQLLVVRGQVFGIVNFLTPRGAHQRSEPQIDTDPLRRDGQWRDLFFEQEGDEIAADRITTDGDGGGGRSIRQGARPADSQWPICFGEGELAVFPRECGSRVGDRLWAVFLFERGEAVASFQQ